MLQLHIAGSPGPITASEIRRLLADRGVIWLGVGSPGEPPYLLPGDRVEVVAASGSAAGLILTKSSDAFDSSDSSDSSGSGDERAIELAVASGGGSAPSAAIGRVSRIWRNGQDQRLDAAPFAQLLRLGPGRKRWIWAGAAVRAARHAIQVVDQLRFAPRAEATELAEGGNNGSFVPFELFTRTAALGLYEPERCLVERHLRPGDRVLDVGCGAGREAFAFAALGLVVTGIDVCDPLVEAARSMASSISEQETPRFLAMPLSTAAFPPASFDAVFLSSSVYSSIQGRARRIEALRRCKRLIGGIGRLMIPVTIAKESIAARLVVDAPRRLLRRALGERLGARILEPGDRFVTAWPDAPALSFQHRFSEAEWLGEIEAAGLVVVDRISTYFVLRPAGYRDKEAPVFCAAGDVRAEKIDRDLLLVDLGNGTTFRLNPTGTLIWELATRGMSVESIAGELAQRVQGAPGEAELLRETRSLVDALVESRLLEPRRSDWPSAGARGVVSERTGVTL